MASNTSMSNGNFEQLSKDEKLRFCQHLIRQAANLAKRSRSTAGRSTKSKASARSKSQQSKRPASAASGTTKKTKSGTSNRRARSKSV